MVATAVLQVVAVVNLNELMYRYFLLVSFFALIFACNSPSSGNSPEDIEKEIQALVHDTLQSKFLGDMYTMDKEARTTQTKMLQGYGFNSQQYKRSSFSVDSLQKIHKAKIDRFLQMHGHPSRFMHSSDARRAPLQIIQHDKSVELREKNFDVLYEAYRDGHIRSKEFASFLDRWYQIKNGSSLVIKNPFKEEFEIDTLLYSLGLKDRMEVVR